METKEVEIEWQGKKEKVTLKKLTFGERNDLMSSFIRVKRVGNNMETQVDMKTMMEQSLLKTIIKAPFQVTIEGIRSLPVDIGDKLYAEADKFNTISQEKK